MSNEGYIYKPKRNAILVVPNELRDEINAMLDKQFELVPWCVGS